MARRGDGEMEFGSDSFLDIVANVVGILIILVVVAAVRASQRPVTEAEIAAQAPELVAESTVDSARARESTEPPAALVAELTAPPAVLSEPEPPAPPPIPDGPSEELLERLRALERKRQTSVLEADRQRKLVREAGQSDQTLARELAALNAAVEQYHGKHETNVRETALFEGTIDQIAGQIATARRQLEALEKAKPPAQQIRHRVTPVGRLVTGEEMHFHLSQNRVAVVPLEELVERLRTQVSRQKEWLAKYRRHQGEVGPVQGFTMRYVVEREEGSVIEDLQQGVGSMRIGVSQWQLVPDSDLKGETVDKAIKPGSAFQRALRKASPGTTLTFWVYPDSFGLYRDLTQHAHLEGFTVAARPLPHGLLIAGSPHGTRSTGQ